MPTRGQQQLRSTLHDTLAKRFRDSMRRSGGSAKRGRDDDDGGGKDGKAQRDKVLAELQAKLKAAEKKAKEAEARNKALAASEAAAKAEAAKLLAEAGSCECPICHDIYEMPVTTPCGHSFCKSCIVECADRKNECPTCRKVLVAAPPAFYGAWHEYRTAIGKACAEWSPSVLIQSTADAARGREKLSAAERSSTYALRILRWYPWVSDGPMPDRLDTMFRAIEAKDVNAKDSCDRSLLWWLASWGQADCFSILARGANVDAADNYLRMTPLMNAVGIGDRPEEVKALLDKKADVHAKDAGGRTALDLIAGFDSPDDAEKKGAHKILLMLAEANIFRGAEPPIIWAKRLANAVSLRAAEIAASHVEGDEEGDE